MASRSASHPLPRHVRPTLLPLSAAALLPVLAACARQAQPAAQVMTPVRIGLSSIPGAVGGQPAAAGGAGGADLFARFVTRDEMAWPGPNRYRTAAGAPGPDYWQQRADYAIAATLDTTNGGTVSGQVTIRYTNNSPDTLRFVWLQLDQNLYRPGS